MNTTDAETCKHVAGNRLDICILIPLKSYSIALFGGGEFFEVLWLNSANCYESWSSRFFK